jgi:glycosyltransferase involved in cell wall biosynthesis
VDVSTIVRHDAQTGIQRVVRAVCDQLTRANLNGIEIFAIAASSRHSYRLVSFDFAKEAAGPVIGTTLELGAGDVFLGLDLCAHLLSRYEVQLWRWQSRGAVIAAVVYDLLPYSNPEWFNRSTVRNFRKWMWVLGRRADLLLPISTSVSRDVERYLEEHHSARSGFIARQVIPLSGDIAMSRPSTGMPDHAASVLAAIKQRPTVLMVGTVEPRKGHAVALAAHKYGWKSDPSNAPLMVFAGKPGWKTEELQAEMSELTLERDGAIWLRAVSDELLTELYEACFATLVCSYGEGYCLPVHEALSHGKFALVRDLPVLREFSSPLIEYFSDDSPAALAAQLRALTLHDLPAAHLPWDEKWDTTLAVLTKAIKELGEVNCEGSSV